MAKLLTRNAGSDVQRLEREQHEERDHEQRPEHDGDQKCPYQDEQPRDGPQRKEHASDEQDRNACDAPRGESVSAAQELRMQETADDDLRQLIATMQHALIDVPTAGRVEPDKQQANA